MVEESSDREPVIQCERIALCHLSVGELVSLFEDPEGADIYSGHSYRNPHRILIDGASPVQWRAPQVQKDPSTNTWFIRWIVLRDTNDIIGSLSFHGPPDERGMLEIGLGVHEKFQRQGFGREALVGMWNWAARRDDVSVFRYTVDPGNTASVALVRAMGFTCVGQQIDEIDGPEDVYEMSVEEYLHRHGQ